MGPGSDGGRGVMGLRRDGAEAGWGARRSGPAIGPGVAVLAPVGVIRRLCPGREKGVPRFRGGLEPGRPRGCVTLGGVDQAGGSLIV